MRYINPRFTYLLTS